MKTHRQGRGIPYASREPGFVERNEVAILILTYAAILIAVAILHGVGAV